MRQNTRVRVKDSVETAPFTDVPTAGREGVIERVIRQGSRAIAVYVRLEPHPEDTWGDLWAFASEDLKVVEEQGVA